MLLERIKKRLHRIKARFSGPGDGRGRVERCSVLGHSILLEVGSEIEQFRASTYSTKEPETLEWIQRYFRTGDVMYDIGANIGLYSLFAAKHLKSQCKVYAFEPEALNFASLNTNIYLNELSRVVVPCCVAVADKLSFAPFYLHPNVYAEDRLGEGLVAGSALHSFDRLDGPDGETFEPIHEQGAVGISLDELWEDFHLDFPNHIKIDVDGTEEKIIAGGSKTLRDPRLKSILVEISTYKGEKDPIVVSLTEAGFHVVTDFSGHSRDQLKGSQWESFENAVFVRP